MTNLPESISTDKALARLKSIVQEILQEAMNQGASAAEAAVSFDRGLSVNVRLGELETIEYHREQGLGVTVYFGHRKGNTSTSDLSELAIRDTVTAACGIARYTNDDDCSGLPEPELLAKSFDDLDLNHPWGISPDQAIETAIQCEDAARNYHSDINNSEGASISTHQGLRVLGNTLGFIHGYPSTRHSLSCSVLGQRGKCMQRDYWYTVARDNLELESATAVGTKAAERTIRRLEARSLTTRQCSVLYCPEVASGLLAHFIGAINGGNVYRKTTFLLDQLNAKIFPSFVHIHELPHIRKALGSACYDSEGVATKSRDLVSEGVLQSYVLDSYSARKLAMRTTGNGGGVRNLILDPGPFDQQSLLKEMRTGLMVTEVMGQGVNLLTGDYSRGVSGFWVENGEIQFPVEEITIAGNLRDMFKNIVALGNDVDIRGNIRVGSIVIEGMTLAGS